MFLKIFMKYFLFDGIIIFVSMSNTLSTKHKKVNMKKNVTKLSGNLLKMLSLAILLAFVAPQMTNAQKANFAGTWTYNAEKSTQPGGQGGGGMRGGGGNFVATQDANLLTVTRTRTGQDGTATTTVSKYTLDGKESLNTPAGRGGNPGTPQKSVATWSADGKTLTIVTTMEFNGNSMKTTQAWTITAPKTLTIVNTRTGQDGAEVKTNQVYEMK
jgi:hypothetical protein